MVLDDVTDRARRVVEAAAALDTEVLGHCDLHALDVGTIPEGLHDRIREANEQHVVNGALSQVMVDPEDVGLHERTEQDAIQVARRDEVLAEGLFDDDAGSVRAPRLSQLFYDGSEERGRDCQVVRGMLCICRAHAGPSRRSLGLCSLHRRSEAVRSALRTRHGPGPRASRRSPVPARATGRGSSRPWPRR